MKDNTLFVIALSLVLGSIIGSLFMISLSLMKMVDILEGIEVAVMNIAAVNMKAAGDASGNNQVPSMLLRPVPLELWNQPSHPVLVD